MEITLLTHFFFQPHYGFLNPMHVLSEAMSPQQTLRVHCNTASLKEECYFV